MNLVSTFLLNVKEGGVFYLWRLWLLDNPMIPMTNLLIGFAILCDRFSEWRILKIIYSTLSLRLSGIEPDRVKRSVSRLLPIDLDVGLSIERIWS